MTVTVAVRPPAVAVMVPVPGVVAVKLPCWSMVPILPVTAQVNASGSAFREIWLYAAVAVSLVTLPGAALRVVMAVLLLAALFTPVVRTFAHYRRSASARRIAGTLLATPEESLTFDQLQTTLSSAKAPQKLRALVSGGYLQNLQINADERTVKLYTPEYEYVQWVCSGCGAKNRERKGGAMRCKYCDQPRTK